MLAIGCIAGLVLFFRSPSRSIVDAFRADLQARGGKLQIRKIEGGLLVDVLHDVRVQLNDGATLEASEVRISRRLSGPPSLRIPAVRIKTSSDALSSFASVQKFDLQRSGLDLDIREVSVECRHRSLGHLVLHGLSRVASRNEHRFAAQRVLYAGATWKDAAFSVTTRNQVLEVTFGSPSNTAPRASARYMPSNGSTAEWMIDVPSQPFGPLRRSLGLGVPPETDVSRITGAFTWVIPDDASLSPRGSFHGVLDSWPKPPWKEAAALTGSSGSIAAVIVPTPDKTGLRLERVEIAAALFDLRGKGSITFAGQPQLEFRASAKRACTELAKHLRPSAYLDLVRAHVTSERPPEKAASVELELAVALPSASESAFRWHLSPGCGLSELTSDASGSN